MFDFRENENRDLTEEHKLERIAGVLGWFSYTGTGPTFHLTTTWNGSFHNVKDKNDDKFLF